MVEVALNRVHCKCFKRRRSESDAIIKKYHKKGFILYDKKLDKVRDFRYTTTCKENSFTGGDFYEAERNAN